MAIPTVAVTVKLRAPDNTPYEGVIVRAKLDKPDFYQGIVVADDVQATTDANGDAVLNVFPNHPSTGLGTTGSVYTFSARPPGARAISIEAQVPNTACNLDTIADYEPVASLTAAQAAQAQAQASAAAASGSATSAQTSADSALFRANSAQVSADAAENWAKGAGVIESVFEGVGEAGIWVDYYSSKYYAQQAAASNSNATTAKNQAVASASDAAASATAASTDAGTASTKAAEAAASASSASTSATSAQAALASLTTEVSDAAASATAAAGSATAAADSATAAAGSANTASTHATTASTQASAASASATQAQISATAADTAAQAAEASEQTASGHVTNASTYAATAGVRADAAAASASDANTKAGQAQSHANTATTQAGIATTQAGLAADAATTAGAHATNAADQANAAAVSKDAAAASATSAAISAGQASDSAATASSASSVALAIYGTTADLNAAQQIMLGYANTASAQANLAAASAASAASVAQQDLSGVTAAALHRSPNAVTALFVYDTAKDSDGGAWVERCSDKSWANESLNGTWLGARTSELMARLTGATLGSEKVANGTFATDTTGWTAYSSSTVAAVAGSMRHTRGATAGMQVAGYSVTGLSVGKLYRFACSVANPSGLQVNAQAFALAAELGVSSTITYTDELVFAFVANASTVDVFLRVLNGSADQYVDWDSVSVKEVTAFNTASGDYYQLATDGKFYRLWKNLAPYTEDYSQSVWNADGTTKTIVDGSDGSTGAAVEFSKAAGGGLHYPRLTNGALTGMGIQHGVTYTVSAKLWSTGSAPSVSFAAFYNGVWNEGTGFSVTSTPTRHSWTFTAGSGFNHGIGFKLAFPAEAASIRMDDFQIEVGSGTTEYEAKSGSSAGVSEVFRGNKAKFPRQAAIVAELQSVTIYDLTEPGRPMWMRIAHNDGALNASAFAFSQLGADGGSTNSSIAAINGKLVVGQNGSNNSQGLRIVDFLGDVIDRVSDSARGSTWRYKGNIAQRHGGLLGYSRSNVAIANLSVNAVAMTVLPNAPVDPVTGLQVPTIAVAVGTGSAGQVGTVLMNDGTAVNYSQGGNDGTSVAFNKRGEVMWGLGSATGLYVLPLATTNVAALSAAAGVRSYGGGWGTGGVAVSASISKFGAPSGNVIATFGRSTREMNVASIIRENPSAPGSSLAAAITGAYNTGWMAGDIRRCLLADVGAGTVSSSDDLWAASGIAVVLEPGWNAAGAGAYSHTSGGGTGPVFRVCGLVGGLDYTVRYTVTGRTTGTIRFRTGAGSAGSMVRSENGTFIETCRNTLGVDLIFDPSNDFNGTISAIAIWPAVTERSVKAKGIAVNGTLAKTAVAAAAQLVAYSGFSASNYLREAYSSDLDYGTAAHTGSAFFNVAADKYGPHNLFTESEFRNGVTDAPSRGGLVSAATMTAYAGAIAFGHDGVTPSFAYKTNLSGVVGQRYAISVVVEMDDGVGPPVFGGGAKESSLNDFALVIAGDAVIPPTSYVVTALGSGKYLVVGTAVAAAANNTFGVVKYAGNSSRTFKVTAYHLSRGSAFPYGYIATTTAPYNGIAPIFHRGYSADAYFVMGLDGEGKIAAELYDGTTTRRATSSAAYNTGTWHKARYTYDGAGTLKVLVNAKEAGAATGAALLTLNNANAVLTVGNSYVLDAPFPGSITLVKLGATVPTTDQGTWMYEQERALFQDGAQCVLPDSAALVDLAYDEATDTWEVVSAGYRSKWKGLVRTESEAAPAGSFLKAAAGSGISLRARSTTNPGVDVTMPSLNLRAQLIRRAEDAARLARITQPFDFDAAASQTDFTLPVGWEALEVASAGARKREGATKDWTRKFDGFKETVSFGVGRAASEWVQIAARRAQ